MTGKRFLVATVFCAMLLGIGSISSAAEISSDFSTLQIESQELAWGNRGSGRFQPPPPPPHPQRNNSGSRDMRRTGNNRGGYNYDRSGRDTRQITVVRRGGYRI